MKNTFRTLKRGRITKGVGVRKMSRDLNYSYSAIYRYENYESKTIPLSRVALVGCYLEIPYDTLFASLRDDNMTDKELERFTDLYEDITFKEKKSYLMNENYKEGSVGATRVKEEEDNVYKEENKTDELDLSDWLTDDEELPAESSPQHKALSTYAEYNLTPEEANKALTILSVVFQK